MAREALIVLALLVAAPFAVAGHVAFPHVQPFTGVPGEHYMAVPDGEPVSLVVFAHGRGHNVHQSWQHHLEEAARNGHVAVAMNFSQGFDGMRAGADMTVLAARALQAEYGLETVTLFSVSMGGVVAALALAEEPDLFDHWIAVEAVSRIDETWAAATAIRHPAATEIEAETGGTPATAPEAYRARSAALRAHEFAARGLDDAIVVHPLNDGLVPFDQGRQTAAALAAAGIPADAYTVLRGSCGEQGTTGTAALLGRAPVDNNPLCLAGHATESSSTHPVMRTSLDATWALLRGELVPAGRETVVDRPDP